MILQIENQFSYFLILDFFLKSNSWSPREALEVHPVQRETLEDFLNVTVNSIKMLNNEDKLICFSINNIKANFGEA